MLKQNPKTTTKLYWYLSNKQHSFVEVLGICLVNNKQHSFVVVLGLCLANNKQHSFVEVLGFCLGISTALL
jgi:hypothetical protein